MITLSGEIHSANISELGTLNGDHIKRLITLSIDNIKRLSLHFKATVKLGYNEQLGTG
jgi:hypothetical protein